MSFKMDHLTLGEIATVEQLSGESFADFGENGVPMGKTLAALAMIAKRRNGEPGFKFNDAMDIPMAEANELLGLTAATAPDASASKADWEAHATDLDIDVKGMTKPQIIAAVEALDNPEDPPTAD